MKLSTKSRYGARILADLAVHKCRVSLKEVTRRQQVSHSYLQHVIAPLVQAGIIESTRGPGGGIQLTSAPNQIKLGDIIRILEGSSLMVDCVSNPALCRRSSQCITRTIWEKVEKSIFHVLDSITLEDVLHQSGEASIYDQCSGD